MARRLNRQTKDRKNYRRSQSTSVHMKNVHKTDESRSQKYVLNLIRYKINHHEYSALSKGLKLLATLQKKKYQKTLF